MSNEKIIEIEETTNEMEKSNEVVEETIIEKIKDSKPAQLIRDHGKKIAAVAIVGAAFLIGRAVGSRLSGGDSEDYDGEDYREDVIDIDDYSVTEETNDVE